MKKNLVQELRTRKYNALSQLVWGVPQSSILGPHLFNIYMLLLAQIMEHDNISYHTYADDMQLYISVSSHDHSPLVTVSQYIHQINEWMCHNILQLNADKTEVIVSGPKDERLKVSAQLDSLSLKARNQDRNLGVLPPKKCCNVILVCLQI